MSDLISRADAIEIIASHDETNGTEKVCTGREITDLLASLPSAEPAPVVAYICDRRRCAICSGEDGGCDHTTDIKHAAHFKNGAGQYFERPYMEKGKNDE